jgi:hypothetical protein
MVPFFPKQAGRNSLALILTGGFGTVNSNCRTGPL